MSCSSKICLVFIHKSLGQGKLILQPFQLRDPGIGVFHCIDTHYHDITGLIIMDSCIIGYMKLVVIRNPFNIR